MGTAEIFNAPTFWASSKLLGWCSQTTTFSSFAFSGGGVYTLMDNISPLLDWLHIAEFPLASSRPSGENRQIRHGYGNTFDLGMETGRSSYLAFFSFSLALSSTFFSLLLLLPFPFSSCTGFWETNRRSWRQTERRTNKTGRDGSGCLRPSLWLETVFPCEKTGLWGKKRKTNT